MMQNFPFSETRNDSRKTVYMHKEECILESQNRKTPLWNLGDDELILVF